MKELIIRRNALIPALDMRSKLEEMLKATVGKKGVGAYLVGSSLSADLERTCDTIKEAMKESGTKLPIITKAPILDASKTAREYALAIRKAGVSAVITVPYPSFEAHKEWIETVESQGIRVIIGGETSHSGFYAQANNLLFDSYNEGYRHLLVPADKSEDAGGNIKLLKGLSLGDNSSESPQSELTFYYHGIISPKDVFRFRKIVGNRHKTRAIVGEAIYSVTNMGKAVDDFLREIVKVT